MFGNISSIPFDKLPELELYVDQVTTFLDDKLSCYKRNDNNKAITKTMINNYTKDKILPVSNKKKYNREHLIMLIIIYHLKSVLSIEDISKFNNKINEIFPDTHDLYSNFVNMQDGLFDSVSEDIDSKIKKIEDFGHSDSKEASLLYFVLYSVLEIELKKLLVEKIIDSFC